MEGQYFIRQGAKITGPVAAETVKKMAAGGGLDRHDELSPDAKKWSFAEEIPGLRFGGPASIDSPYYVFISYCPENQREADVLCKALEASQIPCWIAARDILPGVEAGEATTEALDASRIVVLLLSDQANQSPDVNRQIDRAAHKRRTIITFRLQNVLPRGSMEYYLSNTHWFDAFEGPVEEHAATLAGVVRRVLRKEKLAGSDTEINLRLAETLREMPAQKRATPETSAKSQPPAPPPASTKAKKLAIAASACAMAGILAAGVFFWRSYQSGEGEAIAQQPKPVEPKPVNPTPVNPTPVNPTPVNPTPVNPTPVNPTPVNLNPDDRSGAESPPAPPEPEPDARTHWAGKRGHQFVRTGDKQWSERDEDGAEVHVCDEVARTDLYVELRRRDGIEKGIRLFGGRIEYEGKGGRWLEVGRRHRNFPPHGTWQ
jgi:hypothetical protein